MTQAQSLDVLNLLEQLEEAVLDGTRVPLSGRILVRENDLLDLLDDVRAGLPAAIQQAQQILERQAQILADAQQQAQAIVAQAQQERSLLIEQSSIRLQAEREAQQLRQQTQQECEAVRQQAIAEATQVRGEAQQFQLQVRQESDSLRQQTQVEVDQLRSQTQQQLAEQRQRTLVECEELRRGADGYADQVLRDMEQRLTQMMQIIRNGRQALNLSENTPPPSSPRRRSR